MNRANGQFEAEIQSLQRSLEHARSNHTSMQKMYNSQCGEYPYLIIVPTGGRLKSITKITEEAARLRENLRERDDEIQQLHSEVQGHAEDEQKVCR